MIKKNLKFGAKVPRSLKEALTFDQENGNTLWVDSIEKELKNVRVAFDLLEEGQNNRPQDINLILITPYIWRT